MARKKSTSRGPQRDAIESWMRTTEPVRMALIRSQPGRAATVDAFCPQQTRVGEHDDVGARRDDVLGGELRVAEPGRVGGVGDVLEAERRIDLTDERLRRRREERRIELVVDGEALPSLLRVGDDRADLRLHSRDELRRPAVAAGDLSELANLLVGALEALRAVLVQDGDAESPERLG